ncbi:SGNH/GDSL hydrolase family protein [Euhalothece natronophila Z-M001]|uniref:SGNH/GDSL hydrolase family protein n=1 Tax=Euhalothece natronophila Z-M001 TaxID=522448 RepID=A0A5B8NMF5_9CHRO|nr:SGNH/GDSL hydrolase family protein [Euhalothece natronophila]QDZ40493.1 SGNH/GDSL hydrolase family protein [Euhalothece natronophila Z-M001]
MFKSRRSKLSINKKKQKHQGKSPLLIFASIPFLLIVLEVLARLFFSFTGQPSSIAEQPDNSALKRAYQLQFLSNDEPIQGLSQGGELKVERSPGFGYQLRPNQNNRFLQINEQGWREEESISQDKPEDEVRVFILGGSTAFGYYNESNQETIAQQLENRLNQRVQEQQNNPDDYQPEQLPFYEPEQERLMENAPRIQEGNYQVINAAVPGYMSRNQLSQLALEILPYDPDLIIVMGGYEDLMLDSQESFADIPVIDNYLSNPFQHFSAYLREPFKDIAQSSYLLRMGLDWWQNPEGTTTANTLLLQPNPEQPLASHLPQQPSELVARVQRYRQNKEQMVRLAAGARVPMISAIQPEITGRNLDNLPTQEEEIISELGDSYIQEMQNAYSELDNANNQLEEVFPNNVTSVNLYPIYQDFSNQAFIDPIHLTAEGNNQVAQGLYERIIGMPQMQITPREPGS